MELFIWMLVAFLTVIPFFKILPHFGISQYWAAAAVVPIGTIGLLWWIAMKLQEMERR